MCITYIIYIYTHVSVYTIHIHDKCKHVPRKSSWIPPKIVPINRSSSFHQGFVWRLGNGWLQPSAVEHSVYIDLPITMGIFDRKAMKRITRS